MTGDMMNTLSAARLIGVTENTLRQSRFKKVLLGRPAPPYYRYGYRTIKYNRTELEAWLSGIDYPAPAMGSTENRHTSETDTPTGDKEAPPDTLTDLDACALALGTPRA